MLLEDIRKMDLVVDVKLKLVVPPILGVCRLLPHIENRGGLELMILG